MKKILLITLFASLLSGCLAHMRATGIAEQKNVRAQEQISPFRWEAINVSLNEAKLIKRLAGKPIQSAVDSSKRDKILPYIKEIELKHGRSNNLSLVEVRNLPATGFWLNIPVEAWSFDNEGVRAIYSVVLDEKNFRLSGPWLDDTAEGQVILK